MAYYVVWVFYIYFLNSTSFSLKWIVVLLAIKPHLIFYKLDLFIKIIQEFINALKNI